MRKVVLVSGHSDKLQKDRGSSSTINGIQYIEGVLAVEFRDLIIKRLNEMGVTVYTDANSNILSETLAWLKGKFKSDDLLIDIHWNAFNKKANGTEVIIPKNPSEFEKSFADKLVKLIASYGFVNRGVRTEDKTARKTLGWMRPIGENILIEVCFIDNENDMKLYQLHKNEMAYTIALLIKNEL